MIITETRIYKLYMTHEEFEIFYRYTKDIGYGYSCSNDEEEDEPWLITLYDDMLDDCCDILGKQMDYFDSEGMRGSYNEIRDLLDLIYINR
jgi:hypothetical protein